MPRRAEPFTKGGVEKLAKRVAAKWKAYTESMKATRWTDYKAALKRGERPTRPTAAEPKEPKMVNPADGAQPGLEVRSRSGRLVYRFRFELHRKRQVAVGRPPRRRFPRSRRRCQLICRKKARTWSWS